mmetsp:Transcript_10044/g.29733  ORF Transcript_10044/g.29733 Transcript_10044/m.29733 type:complete len:505 (+) Transcript_10044:1674-3188(+)
MQRARGAQRAAEEGRRAREGEDEGDAAERAVDADDAAVALVVGLGPDLEVVVRGHEARLPQRHHKEGGGEHERAAGADVGEPRAQLHLAELALLLLHQLHRRRRRAAAVAVATVAALIAVASVSTPRARLGPAGALLLAGRAPALSRLGSGELLRRLRYERLGGAARCEAQDGVGVGLELLLVRDEHHRGAAIPQEPVEHAGAEEVRRHLRVHGGERVVEQHEVRAGVARAREAHARLLPAAEVHALLADLRVHAVGQLRRVHVQRAGGEHALEALRIVGGVEEHVGPQRAREDPGLLWAVAERSGHGHATRLGAAELAEHRREQRGLTATHGAVHHGQLAAPRVHRDAIQRERICGALRQRLLLGCCGARRRADARPRPIEARAIDAQQLISNFGLVHGRKGLHIREEHELLHAHHGSHHLRPELYEAREVAPDDLPERRNERHRRVRVCRAQLVALHTHVDAEGDEPCHARRRRLHREVHRLHLLRAADAPGLVGAKRIDAT